MSDKISDSEGLVEQLRNGDDDVLGDLIDGHRDRLERVIRFRLDYRLVGRIAPSDVIQDVFISAKTRLEHFRNKPDMPFFVWLRLIVQQQLIDLHRQHLHAEKRDVRKEISIERPQPAAHTSLAIAAQLVGDQTSPSMAFSRGERIRAIENALNTMEPTDREVIALRHFEELSNNEVAEVLEISVQAASKRYVRAMKRMKEIVSAIPGFE